MDLARNWDACGRAENTNRLRRLPSTATTKFQASFYDAMIAYPWIRDWKLKCHTLSSLHQNSLVPPVQLLTAALEQNWYNVITFYWLPGNQINLHLSSSLIMNVFRMIQQIQLPWYDRKLFKQFFYPEPAFNSLRVEKKENKVWCSFDDHLIEKEKNMSFSLNFICMHSKSRKVRRDRSEKYAEEWKTVLKTTLLAI